MLNMTWNANVNLGNEQGVQSSLLPLGNPNFFFPPIKSGLKSYTFHSIPKEPESLTYLKGTYLTYLTFRH